jgi:hypothetical protein
VKAADISPQKTVPKLFRREGLWPGLMQCVRVSDLRRLGLRGLRWADEKVCCSSFRLTEKIKLRRPSQTVSPLSPQKKPSAQKCATSIRVSEDALRSNAGHPRERSLAYAFELPRLPHHGCRLNRALNQQARLRGGANPRIKIAYASGYRKSHRLVGLRFASS